MLASHAALLLMPGHDEAVIALREAVAGAAELLSRVMRDEGLGVHAAERPIHAEVDGRALGGRPDLVLDDPQGRIVLVDFKWSGEARYREALREGTAVQLAIYGALLRAVGRHVRTTGYLVLQSRRLLVRGDALAFAEQVNAEPLDATWDAIRRSLDERSIELAAGEVQAPGSAAVGRAPRAALVDGRIVLEPPCRWCALDLLCGRAWSSP